MEGNDILYDPRMLGLYGLFRLKRRDTSIRAPRYAFNGDVTLDRSDSQVEFKTLGSLIPVRSHSQTKKSCILKRYLLPGDVGKVDSITPNPKLKSVLKTFGEAHSIRKRERVTVSNDGLTE
jgi:hypothetical protein